MCLFPLDVVSVEDVMTAFYISVIGPIRIYQDVRPLSNKPNAPKGYRCSAQHLLSPTWTLTTLLFVGAYGVSQAVQNRFTALLETEVGNEDARMMGMEQAPDTVEESASRTIELIDKSTREQTSIID
ncbi:toxin biosynthesis [Colletotrichum sojae]|uniref:Toxin biosynthesis n=1 Tax=Colletotrichum sojae TaxID=2175907 RepID=A0A8H6J456_9PEZI|nr:toxin biosynthesis [Colletotrichum sojae]